MTDTPFPTETPLHLLEKRDLELGPFSDVGAPADAGPWRHWRLRNDETGVAWLVIDKQGASANTLSEDVLTELDAVLTKVEQDRPRG